MSATPTATTASDASTIRWGILGTGYIAREFANGLGVLPDAKIQAVASRSQTRANDFAGSYSSDVSAYDRYEALVQDPNIDVVYIATPHSRHKDDCLLCLNNNKPVLCEKPFTINAGEAAEVFRVAREKNLFCMEAMWMRFMPLIQRVKQMTVDDALGDIKMLTADFSIPAPFDRDNRFFNLDLAGGALLDRGVYCVSLATMLFGAPREITSQAVLGETGVDENAAIIMRFENNRLAVFTTSLHTRGPISATILGSTGKVHLPELFFRPTKITVTPYEAPRGDGSGGGHSGLGSKLINAAMNSRVGRGLRNMVKRSLGEDGTIRQPLEGNGMNYEAAEVMSCLRQGKIESNIMPHEETLIVMRAMDEIRSQWGLKYPGED